MSKYRMTLRQFMKENEIDTVDQLLEMHAMDSVVPALCTDYCMVEPDGRCEHGCPSILIALRII